MKKTKIPSTITKKPKTTKAKKSKLKSTSKKAKKQVNVSVSNDLVEKGESFLLKVKRFLNDIIEKLKHKF